MYVKNPPVFDHCAVLKCTQANAGKWQEMYFLGLYVGLYHEEYLSEVQRPCYGFLDNEMHCIDVKLNFSLWNKFSTFSSFVLCLVIVINDQYWCLDRHSRIFLMMVYIKMDFDKNISAMIGEDRKVQVEVGVVRVQTPYSEFEEENFEHLFKQPRGRGPRRKEYLLTEPGKLATFLH